MPLDLAEVTSKGLNEVPQPEVQSRKHATCSLCWLSKFGVHGAGYEGREA